MTEQLPGVKVHIHEGRVTGTFDLPPAEMEQVSYGGRVVLVLVADVSRLAVADTKDGDTKASWTLKAVDAGIVRDPGMKDHLANVLYLDGLEASERLYEEGPPTGAKMVGEYDDEGAFMGFRREEDEEDQDGSTDLSVDAPLPNSATYPPQSSGTEVSQTGVGRSDKMLERFLQEA